MPIYEYRCSACGHEQEILRKMSDAPLTLCPACGKETLTKLVSAAGFQLKGSGWYATDFKGGAKRVEPENHDESKKSGDDAKKTGDGAKSNGGSDLKGDSGSKDKDKSADKSKSKDASSPKQESRPKEESKAAASSGGGASTTGGPSTTN